MSSCQEFGSGRVTLRPIGGRLLIWSSIRGEPSRWWPGEIGVGEQLLGRWVAVERSRSDDPPGALDADERAELERLRAENAELRMDREFLKKAAAFFVTENQNR